MKNFAKITILLLVCFLFLGFGCKKQDTTTSSTEEQSSDSQTTVNQGILSLTSSSVESSTNTNLRDAKSKLIYWDRKAKPIAIIIDFYGDLQTNKINSTYVFNSALATAFNKYFYFAVSYNSLDQSIRTLVHKEDYLKNISNPAKAAIDLKYFKTTWIDAFKKAEEAGGKTFREKDSSNTKINLSLYKGSPNNYLYWFVTYTRTNAEEAFTAQVNASNSELIKSSGADTTNSSNTSSTTNSSNNSANTSDTSSTDSTNSAGSSGTNSETSEAGTLGE